MNKVFKVVFSKAKGMFVVGSEYISSNGKKSVKAAVAAVALSAIAVAGSIAQAQILTGDIKSNAPIKSVDLNVANGMLDGYVSTTKDRNEKGAIEISENGVFEISDSTFTNNQNGTSDNNGELVKPGASVLYVNKGATGTVKNSAFSKNKDYYFDKTMHNESAGAIFNNGNLTVANTIFSENADNFQGGAINNYSEGNLTISNSAFNNNGRYAAPVSDTRWGGAIINYGKMNDTGSSYTKNAVVTGGGAIYTFGNNQELVIKGDSFTDNSAGGHGGAVYNAQGTMIDSNSMYTGNHAWATGGAIRNNATLSIIGDKFKDNYTTAESDMGKGGAITNAANARATIVSSSFDGNKSYLGGAIYNYSLAYMIVSGETDFTNNSAVGNGGAIYNAGNLTLLGTNNFNGNTEADKPNDITNSGLMNFGESNVTGVVAHAYKDVHIRTYIGSGINGIGTLNLNEGELEIAGTRHVEQGNIAFKQGTTTTITLNSNHILKDGIAKDAWEVADQIAGTVANEGYTFHTTGAGLTVENGAVLQVADAQANKTYLVAYNTGGNGKVDTDENGWREKDNLKQTNIESTSKLLKLKRVDNDTIVSTSPTDKEEVPSTASLAEDNRVVSPEINGTVMITAEAADISEVLPCVDAPKNLTGLVSTGIDINSDKAGVKFLSRVTDTRYMSDTNQMTKTINSAVQIGNLGGVKDMTYSGSGMFQRSIENHLSLTRTLQFDKEDVKLHEKDHTDLWVDVIGQHTRRTGISGACHGKDCDGGNSDSHGLRTDMGAIIVGLDRTNKEGDKHWGIAGMLGTGHAGSTGHLNHTKNDINFWGLSLYGGIDRNNWNLMGNIAYSHFSSDIEQNLPTSLGMGNKLKADVSSHLWSVGGKAEYRYDLSESTAIKPHVGLRWDRMTTSGFSTKAQGETVFTTKRDTQDIYSLPIGLAIETGLKTDSGWVIRPQGDIAVVFATGDLKDTNRFRATGVDAYDTIRTKVVDETSITASVGIDMQKGNKSFGLHYDAVSSSNNMWQGFMAKFVYKFE